MGVLKLSSLGRHFRDPNYRALAALKTMSETDENFVRANPCSLEPWTQLSLSLTRKKVSHSGLRSKNRVVPRLTQSQESGSSQFSGSTAPVSKCFGPCKVLISLGHCFLHGKVVFCHRQLDCTNAR